MLNIIIVLQFHIFIFPSSANSQNKKKLGLSIKAQFIPHIGITYDLSNRLTIRPSIYLDWDKSNHADFFDSFMGSLSILFKDSKDSTLLTYWGANVSIATHKNPQLQH